MTATDGQQILDGLIQTRKFFEQISLLLRTAEDLLKESGWDNHSSSMKSSDTTSHLYHPRKWMPKEVSRFFVNEEHKDLLTYVGVLLDQEGAWRGFNEPWITCGLFQFLPDKNPHEKFNSLSWVTQHLVDERDPDGNFYTYEWPPEEQEGLNLLYDATLALPLVQIRSAEDLKQKIIVPLLEEVRKVPQNKLAI
ncbi:MAG: hypothetical protein DDT32_01224 [Syntrophomonadaceae bacterium]|nr:hypothetical protein [Bacillota bacterium]MBT9147467.1 hypothetical protein [Bacillota bacterium]